MKRIKLLLKLLLLVLFVANLVLVTKLVYEDEQTQRRVEKKFDDIRQSFVGDITGAPDEVYIDGSVTVIKDLRAQNSDVIGYMSIPNSTIAYPVMQSPDEPDFYLNHDINKEYSFYGTPYLSAYCTLQESDNLIIYGHNINGGRMFGQLLQYKNKEFFENHKEIEFVTSKKDIYRIFAVFSVSINDFEYWKFVMAKNEGEYKEFISKATGHSCFNTGVTPSYGDKLITLSTCDNARGNNYRFVVMGVKK
ncbi:MAG: class B sortase [Lachnospiraceae bacterium]|nr:class B sortase [Lachnospiraceae bacterium]